MSFWDTLKPAKKTTHATGLELSADQKQLTVTWSDGAVQQVDARRLRQYCPCAACVEEWSGKRTFEVDTIDPDMKAIAAESVGNYAVSFTFGDAHRTGIYQWAYLRDLAEAEQKSA